MSDAFRCDGCKGIFDGDPQYTIERSDDIMEMSERGEWGACSWRCVARIAHDHEVRQGTWSPHA